MVTFKNVIGYYSKKMPLNSHKPISEQKANWNLKFASKKVEAAGLWALFELGWECGVTLLASNSLRLQAAKGVLQIFRVEEGKWQQWVNQHLAPCPLRKIPTIGNKIESRLTITATFRTKVVENVKLFWAYLLGLGFGAPELETKYVHSIKSTDVKKLVQNCYLWSPIRHDASLFLSSR